MSADVERVAAVLAGERCSKDCAACVAWVDRIAAQIAPLLAEQDAALARVRAIKTQNGPISPKNLRWAATHEALCRSFIFDVLTGLADALDPERATNQPNHQETP